MTSPLIEVGDFFYSMPRTTPRARGSRCALRLVTVSTPADRTGTGGGLEEDGEDIEVLELPFSEALAVTRDGRITDGETIMLLQWAALHGPFAPTGTTR